MFDNNETLVSKVDRFDAKIILDLLKTIFSNCFDINVSDKDFRDIIKNKIESMEFLLETGVIQPTKEQIDFVNSILDEDDAT